MEKVLTKTVTCFASPTANFQNDFFLPRLGARYKMNPECLKTISDVQSLLFAMIVHRCELII